MYSTFEELWEGWSKNWFIGLDRNILKAISASVLIFWIFSVPWIMITLMTIDQIAMSALTFKVKIGLVLASISILLQYFTFQNVVRFLVILLADVL